MFTLVRKVGSVNGSPWVGRLSQPVSHCRVLFTTSTLASVQTEVRLIRTCDLNLETAATMGEEEFECNMAIVEALGKVDEWESLEEHWLYVLIWATFPSSSSEHPGVDQITCSFTFEDVHRPLARQSFDVPFAVSYFTVDVRELDFGDCSSSEQVVREFTIKNTRDNKLQYRMDWSRVEQAGDEDVAPQLALAWYETGEAISMGSIQTLAGKSFARIHATLRAQAGTTEGRFKWLVCVENERNFENVANIAVSATRTTMPAALLLPSLLLSDAALAAPASLALAAPATTPTPSPPTTTATIATSIATMASLDILQEGTKSPLGVLNFGEDCVVGNVVCKRIVLKNTGAVAIEVSLHSPDSATFGAVSMTGSDFPVDVAGEEAFGDDDSEEESSAIASLSPLGGEEVETLSPPPPGRTPLEDLDDTRTLSPPPDDLFGVIPVRRGSAPNSPTANHYHPPVLQRTKLSDFGVQTLPAGAFIRLAPGEEKEARIHYLPQGVSGGNRTTITMRLVFTCSTTKLLVQHQALKRTLMAECKACTSLFSVSPTRIKLGDCLLHQTKTVSLIFTNLSDVETTVRTRLESRMVKIEPAIITIEPKGKVNATLVFLPRRTSPRYCEEFACVNSKNKRNGIVVRLESHNIDVNSFPYHTFFYNLVAFNSTGEEEDFTNWPTFFGPTLLDGVNVRRIGIRNLTKRELALHFKLSTDELQILTFVDQHSAESSHEFAKVMEEFENSRFASQTVGGKHALPVDKQVEQRLNYLATKLRKVSSVILPPEPDNKLMVLVLLFRPNSAKRPGVSGALKYEGHLSLTIDMPHLLPEDLKSLQDALRWNLGKKEEGKKLVPSPSSNALSSLVPAVESTTTAVTSAGGDEKLPFTNPRILYLRTMVAKAEMKVSQSHFNHGLVDNSWERRPFQVMLFNLSGETLVFKIERKTRVVLPILPGDELEQQQTNTSCVEIEDHQNCGVIPAYSNSTVNLLFVPKIWAGRVKETLLIRNLLVPSSTMEIVVKAVVSLPEHFRVEYDELDFGPIFPGITGESAQLLTLVNTSDKSRDLTLQVSKESSDKWPKAHLAVFCFYVFPPQIEGAPTTSTTFQEQMEEIEFKIRLAVRKNDSDKIAVLNRKMQALQSQQPKEGQESVHTRGLVFGPLKGSRRVVLPPKSSVQVAMKLHVRLMASFATYQGQALHSVKVFETRQENTGPMKHIPFSCRLFSDRQQFYKATVPRSSSLGASPVVLVNSPYITPMQYNKPVPPLPFSLTDGDLPAPATALAATAAALAQSTAAPVKQIEVGARNLKTWFKFALPRVGGADPVPPSPNNSKSTSVDLGKFRVVFADEEQRQIIEMKPIVVESYRQLVIEARYLRGGRHLIPLVFESAYSSERHEVLVKGQASYLEMTPSALDFGNLIVVPEEPSKPHQSYFSSKPMLKSRQHFTVTNTHKEAVFVTAESNSNFFVLYLSQDESRIDRIMLEPGQEMKMFVVIKPALLADAWRGVCRLWKGGIVVTCEVGSEDDRDMETHHVARFQSLLSLTANVGMSLFSVGEQRVAGALTVRNESEKIPLQIECTASEEGVVFSPASYRVEISPLTEADVLFHTTRQESMLCFGTIVIRNVDSGEVKRVSNVACVYKNDLLKLERALDFRVAVPVRKKNDLFVVAHDALGANPVRVRNMSANRVRMVMSCRLLLPNTAQPVQAQDPPLIGGAGVLALSALQPASIKDFVPRAQCVIGAGQAKDIVYRFPRDSKLLPDSFQGWLAFEVKVGEVPMVMAAVRFRGEARISQFEVVSNPTKINAGEVGTANGWRKEATLCKLVNPDRFVPAEVAISVASPTKHLILTPLNPRLFLEPGSLEHPVVIRVQALPSYSTASVSEVEAVLTMTNVLNDSNEFSLPVKIRILPKRFHLEREGEEMVSTLALPGVSELSEEDGTSVVNDWIAVWNPSHLTEAMIDCQVISQYPGETSLSMVFRSTGVPVPSSFAIKPQERVGIRVILRLERGCSLRGDQIDFGAIKFSCGKEEKFLRMVGRISTAIPLWRCSASPERPVLKPNEQFSITLTNDTKLPFQIKCVIPHSEYSHTAKVCVLHSFVDQDGVEKKPSDAVLMAPFGSVCFHFSTLQRYGKAKIKFISSLKEMQSIEFDLTVSHSGPNSLEEPLSFVAANAMASQSSPTKPLAISGCPFVGEPGLYEIDAGLLTEAQTWQLTLKPTAAAAEAGTDWFLVRGKNTAFASEEWVSVRRSDPLAFEVQLNPQPLTQVGGFFSAYLVFPRVGVVRIKMEVVMVLDDLQLLPAIAPSHVFEVSPNGAIVSGPLAAGRVRSLPFTLFNRHAKAPLVFQLNVVGVKGGLMAWFSHLGCASEEHRRVTVNSSSSCRLQLNLHVPAVGVQTEDFADLEINVSCRQLRNSILTLKVCLPARGFQPGFALNCTSAVRVGEPIAVTCNRGDEVVCVGPEWIKTTTTSSQPIFTALVRAKLGNGDTLTVTEAACPGLLTFYNSREAHDFVTVKVSPALSVSVTPSLQGASMWRDAIELEMVKTCVLGKGLDLGGILFRELLELILADAGGRGASLVSLFFKLQFPSTTDGNAQKELYIKELKSVPESLLYNIAEL
ncbi:hypothetical protein BASA81_002310 [Batrachochytrium salamandrivorans]|nr:hypothetical protein BASA81_002310 [Batrachochytrium salamandrivorans]